MFGDTELISLAPSSNIGPSVAVYTMGTGERARSNLPFESVYLKVVVPSSDMIDVAPEEILL